MVVMIQYKAIGTKCVIVPSELAVIAKVVRKHVAEK